MGLMKTWLRNPVTLRFFACFLLLAITGCASRTQFTPAAQSPPPPDQLQAGMAEIDITPPVGYRLAGDFKERLATGTHDPLKAKALILRQGNEQIALVICDLVGLSLNVTTNARARASRATGIPVSHIILAATHSHTGPLFDDVRRDYFHNLALATNGEDPHETIYYPTFLVERLVKAITQAQARLEPVEVAAGIANRPGLTFNRRYHMKNGSVATNPGILNSNIISPAGPVDSQVGILLVKSRQRQQALGGLTIFAMHADTVGGTDFSADYPYYIEQTLRNAFSQNYISLFGAGTCGDLNHIDVSKRPALSGFDLSEHLGSSIAETVIKDLPQLDAIQKPALAVKSKTLILPLQTATPEEVTEAKMNMAQLNNPKFDFTTKVKAVKALDLTSRDPTLLAEVQVVRLDNDTAIVCLPAEIFVELGLAIKKASPFKTTFVISICNDRPSYVPTLKAFQEGSYEVTNSRLKAGSGEAMVETASQLLKELKE